MLLVGWASRRRLLPALGRGARGGGPPLRRPRALAGLGGVGRRPPSGLPVCPPPWWVALRAPGSILRAGYRRLAFTILFFLRPLQSG